MEQPPLAFAGVVTILGMGVVFSFLALLSAGMLGLRRLQRAAEARPPATEAVAPVPEPAPSRRDARWVAAAVAAYLAQQGRFDEVSAAPWDPSRRLP